MNLGFLHNNRTGKRLWKIELKKDEGQEVNGESHSNDRASFMVQSKVVSVEKGKIVENKPSTEVHKSIFFVEKRSSDVAREKLFHVNMQRKNTMVVDVFVTSECIHPYFLCIVTRCLFWDVFKSFHAPMFRSGSFYNEKVMSSHLWVTLLFVKG